MIILHFEFICKSSSDNDFETKSKYCNFAIYIGVNSNLELEDVYIFQNMLCFLRSYIK